MENLLDGIGGFQHTQQLPIHNNTKSTTKLVKCYSFMLATTLASQSINWKSEQLGNCPHLPQEISMTGLMQAAGMPLHQSNAKILPTNPIPKACTQD